MAVGRISAIRLTPPPPPEPKGRISSVRLSGEPPPPPADPKGRVAAVRLTGTPVAGSKGRVSVVRLTGPVLATPKGRISAVRVTGQVALVVAPFLPRTVEPLADVDVTAVMQQGVASGWSWRAVSTPAGVTVTLQGTGASRVLRTPGLVAGGTIVLGVRALNGAVQSPEASVTLNVLPQITWVRHHGGQWQPGPYIL